MRTVIIMGSGTPLDRTFEGAEVWACNRAHKIQCTPPPDPAPKNYPFRPWPWPKIDRVYAMDSADGLFDPAATIAEWNALNVPIYLPEADSRIPKSIRFPMEAVHRALGPDYYLCTPAYMLAHAIFELPDRIILWRMFRNPKHDEYLPQKSCMDYWLGFARARGIQVSITDDSFIGRPLWPYLSDLYGYEKMDMMRKALWDAGVMPDIEDGNPDLGVPW